MNAGSFKDAALVLVGHGSTLNVEAGAPVYAHADEFRRRDIFGQVQECFWKLEPSLSGVLRGVFSVRAFVVPVLISHGYFTDELIPRELGFPYVDGRITNPWNRSGQRIYYCEPVGTHPSMSRVLLSRAHQIVERHPFPRTPNPRDTTLFIVGHGTERNQDSRVAVEQHVDHLRQANVFADVCGVFIDEAPYVRDCYELADTRNVIVVPYFIGEGMHSVKDIPVMLGEPERIVLKRLAANQPTWRNPTERRGKRIWYASSIGSESLITDVILDRVEEAAREGNDE